MMKSVKVPLERSIGTLNTIIQKRLYLVSWEKKPLTNRLLQQTYKVNKSVTHLLDSVEEGKTEIWQALNSADKDALKAVYK